jgi:hypothetical protein
MLAEPTPTHDSETAAEVEEIAPRRLHAPGGAAAGFLAFALYLVASVLIWGGSMLAHLSTYYIPRQDSPDSDFFRWALAWGPWALTHGRSPLFSDVVFAPSGASLTWVTVVPGPAVAMWPVTHFFGPLAAYNVLVLLAPALGAWAAYLVCRCLTDRFWPSLLGGFLYGFSAYIAIQFNHPNMALVFPIPLAVYLMIRRLEGSIRPVPFVALMSLTMLGLWSISIELFATATAFAAIALVIAFLLAGEDRPLLFRATLLVGIGYLIVGAIVFVPYLLPTLHHAPQGLMHNPERRYNDLLRFVLPRDRQLIGGDALVSFASRHTETKSGGTTFLGVGLVAMLIGYAVTERRRKETWGLLAFVIVSAVLSLGPTLYVAGHERIPLPGEIISKFPLLQQALPGRFIAYTDLALAVIAALWLARAKGRFAWVRWAVVACGAAMLIPNVMSPPWHVPDTTPAFFLDGRWSGVLAPGETALVIPEKNGEEMAWQAETDFGFRLPNGYVGATPEGIPESKTMRGVSLRNGPVPHEGTFRAWLAERDVTAIVMADVARPRFETVLRDVGFVPVYEADGVSVWRQI